jgi:hypothetical protein
VKPGTASGRPGTSGQSRPGTTGTMLSVQTSLTSMTSMTSMASMTSVASMNSKPSRVAKTDAHGTGDAPYWERLAAVPSLADYDSLMLDAAPATGPGAIGAPPADLEGGDRPGTGHRASELLVVGTDDQCSPRHRMPCTSPSKGKRNV